MSESSFPVGRMEYPRLSGQISGVLNELHNMRCRWRRLKLIIRYILVSTIDLAFGSIGL